MDLCTDPFAELAIRAPAQAVCAEGQPGRDSPFTSTASKVIIPRHPSSSSRASSTLSHVSSRRSSRMRMGPNPFEAANSSGVIEEGNEEEEVDALTSSRSHCNMDSCTQASLSLSATAGAQTTFMPRRNYFICSCCTV